MARRLPPSPNVLIAGAGPVGLFLAARFAAQGVEALAIDRRSERSASTRAIGVHPPGLAALDAIGAGDGVRARAARVARASAFGVDGPLGVLELADAAEVLSLPQPWTESIVEARIAALGGPPPARGVELVGFEQDADGVSVRVATPAGPERMRATLLVGCDGRGSRVREVLGIGGRGGAYPDRYLMADVVDATATPDAAEIHLHGDGVVESFPLPGGRRWVAHVGSEAPGGEEARDLAALLAIVARRVGASPAARPGTPVSPFGIERFLADRFTHGRVVLAGDAAHVVSPIGGQGMNLGWLDAEDLVAAVVRGSARGGRSLGDELDAYGARRRARARRAIWRAECNTRLGRPAPRPLALVRDAGLRRLLAAPFAGAARAFFTMRGLA